MPRSAARSWTAPTGPDPVHRRSGLIAYARSMPHPRIRLSTAGNHSEVQAGLDRIRAELRVPDSFPVPVLAEAARVANTGPAAGGDDRSDLPFFTVDPTGSMDLDQAMHLERRPG